MKLKKVSIFLLFVILTSCAKTPTIPHPILDCPEFPDLNTIPDSLEVDPDVEELVNENYILLIEWGEEMERRAGCGR